MDCAFRGAHADGARDGDTPPAAARADPAATSGHPGTLRQQNAEHSSQDQKAWRIVFSSDDAI